MNVWRKANGMLYRYMVLPIVVQFPLFLSLFSALRALAAQAHLLPGAGEPLTYLAPLGLSAPLYLHLPDPYFLLPALGAGLSISALAINNNVQGIPQAGLTPRGMKLGFSLFTGLFSIFAGYFPAVLQLSFMATSGTMLLQQGMLRLEPVRVLFGFPAAWPLAPEVLAERAKRRALDEPNAVVTFMKPYGPLFRRLSNAAEGHWRSEPRHEYLSLLSGLRDPGGPYPPQGPPPAPAAVASVGNSGGAGAPGRAGMASPLATPAAGPQTLHVNRPKKTK